MPENKEHILMLVSQDDEHRERKGSLEQTQNKRDAFAQAIKKSLEKNGKLKVLTDLGYGDQLTFAAAAQDVQKALPENEKSNLTVEADLPYRSQTASWKNPKSKNFYMAVLNNINEQDKRLTQEKNANVKDEKDQTKVRNVRVNRGKIDEKAANAKTQRGQAKGINTTHMMKKATEFVTVHDGKEADFTYNRVRSIDKFKKPSIDFKPEQFDKERKTIAEPVRSNRMTDAEYDKQIKAQKDAREQRQEKTTPTPASKTTTPTKTAPTKTAQTRTRQATPKSKEADPELAEF